MPRFAALVALAGGLAIAPQAATADSGAGGAAPGAGAAAAAEGEKLAKQGRFREAIGRFKAADALTPRAANDCFIALAYRRLEAWGLADLYAERCRARAGAADPEPTWMAKTRADIADGIQRAGLFRIVFSVAPPAAAAAATMTLSVFGGGESFAPTAVWLPAGTHVAVCSAAGFVDATVTFRVADSTPRQVELTLTAAGAGDATRPPAAAGSPDTPSSPADPGSPAGAEPSMTEATGHTPSPTGDTTALRPSLSGADPSGTDGGLPGGTASPGDDVRPPRSPRYLAVGVTAAAAAGLAFGVAFHVKAVGTRSDAEESAAAYDRLIDTFERQRALAITGYAAGAIAGGVALWLWMRPASPREPIVSAGVGDGSAAYLWVTWSR